MEDLSRLRKLLLLVLSTDQRNESATGIEMLVASLKRDGKDIYWLADRLTNSSGGGGASFGAIDAAYRRGLAEGRAAAGNQSQGAKLQEIRDAYDRGFEQGRAAASRGPTHSGDRGEQAWAPHREKMEWNEPDPARDAASKMPPQRWAVWLLCRRKQMLSEWEIQFCENVANWLGVPTDKQKAVLERIIYKVW